MKNSKWSGIDDVVLTMFANGLISGKSLYNRYKGTEDGGLVRNILRIKGVENARKCARDVIRRRRMNDKKVNGATTCEV